MLEKNHDYHIVDPSPWPALGALSAVVLFTGAVLWIHEVTALVLILGFMSVVGVMIGWWRSVIAESMNGDHKSVVRIGLRYGVILFIISEVFFFAAWFWAWFSASMYPGDIVYMYNQVGTWPPTGINVLDPWGLPFVNTLILLTSGCTLTWAHHALKHNNNRDVVRGLATTVGLGIVFLILQMVEYGHAIRDGLTMSNTIYGSVFYMATGFHGFHVFVGVVFLSVCLVRAMKGRFTLDNHMGFEVAAWYWHFVDGVWLFLFGAVYLGSAYFLRAA